MTKKENKGRNDYRKAWLLGLLAFVVMFSFVFLAQRNSKLEEDTNAANLANFNPGYIISDFQMGNYTSMSEADIQNFLKSKNSCNDTNIGRYTAGDKVGYFSESSPPRTWHVSNGHFVCMADEVFNGGTAAHIIWQAAQDYKINPQVLIVLLEKEQSLVSDTFPHSQQYRSATGYGCPDTAPCSEKYYGLNNQVRNAASLFRTVLDGGWTNYPLGDNYIQYNPNSACGGSVVNIRNLATSALYRYTPYQPNSAALSGWNDGCGAYGNRNFYAYFEDWFGGILDDGWPDLSTVLKNNRVKKEESDQDYQLRYRTYIQHYGWLDYVSGGEMSGTAGYSARVEGVQIKIENVTGVEYRTHVQDIGWTDYVKDGELSGTTGQSKRVEALQIRFTGNLAKNYDVYYRVHVANIGWMGWVKNDEISGTVGQSKQIEAIQIKIAKKEIGGPNYSTHVQNVGWMSEVNENMVSGTIGKSLRVEAFKIKLTGALKDKNISYRAHVQNIGWMDWAKNGEIAGTTGKALRVEALEIKLDDAEAAKYDIYYRAHVQNIGWMDWVKNGEIAGTTGKALRVEALEIKLLAK